MGFLISIKKRAREIEENTHNSLTSQSPNQAGSVQHAHGSCVESGPPFDHNSVTTHSLDEPTLNQSQSDESSTDVGMVGGRVQTISVAPSVRNLESVGPFGGLGGSAFDDGIRNTIKQVLITWGLGIDHICVEYDQNGVSVLSQHGGGGGGNKHRILLDYPDEFIVSVWGYYGKMFEEIDLTIVRSLTFQSNRRTYGPYGVEVGTYFSFTSTGGKIVGFHGSSGLYLDSIGMHSLDLATVGLGVAPTITRNPVSVGPVGGLGGCAFDDGFCKAVKQVIITWGLAIDRIRIEYDQNGVSFWAEHGGPGGENKHTILLDYPDEFLISVCGHYGNFFEGSSITVVRSLTFQSNRRTYGPYGVEEGRLRYFSFPSNGGKIIGFHGRSGLFLDSIGAFLEPPSNS